MKKLFSLLICLFMLVSVTGCVLTKEGEVTTAPKPEVKEEQEVVEEPEIPESETEVSIIGKYVSNGDMTTYVELRSDNTFKGLRNYCAGYDDVSGTYELNGTTLTLYFDQLEPVGGKKATDVNKATLDSNGKITSFETTGGSYYLLACSGGDFILEG